MRKKASLIIPLLALLVGGCANIQTGNEDSAPNTRLSPNPPVILVDLFDGLGAQWMVGRKGTELDEFKSEFPLKFQAYLTERLEKVAPSKKVWPLNALPDKGWLVRGEFLTVNQGSRALRTMVGGGAGETVFQTRVYVYDLSISKDEYILSFDTGVPDHKGLGKGSGKQLSALGGNPVGTGMNLGAGLCLDMTRTSRQICEILGKYVSPHDPNFQVESRDVDSHAR